MGPGLILTMGLLLAPHADGRTFGSLRYQGLIYPTCVAVVRPTTPILADAVRKGRRFYALTALMLLAEVA
jgi:hypothetical protein